MARQCIATIAGIVPAAFRFIVFSPRNAHESRITHDQLQILSQTNPSHVHLSDLDGIEGKDVGLFSGLRDAIKCGIDPKKLVPHVSVIAHKNRKKIGIDTFRELQEMGINKALLITGIPAGADIIRGDKGEFYTEAAQDKIRNLAELIPDGFKVSLTFYPDAHPATKQIVYKGVAQHEIQRFEVDNFLQKAALIAEASGRDPQEVVSGCVMQHCFTPESVKAAAYLIQSRVGYPFNIVPSILPIGDPELFAAFCRGGFAEVPQDVAKRVEKVKEAGVDPQKKEEAQMEANEYAIALTAEFAGAFSEIALYPGRSKESAWQVVEVVKNLIKRGFLVADTPAATTEISDAQKVVETEQEVAHS